MRLHHLIHDNVFFGLSVTVVVMTWVASIASAPLARQAALHTSLLGTDDAFIQQTLPVHLLLPLFQALLLLVFLTFYHTPEQAQIGRALLLRDVPLAARPPIIRAYRHFIMVTLVLLELLLAELFLNGLQAEFDMPASFYGWLTGLLIGLLLFVVGLHWSWIQHLVRRSST